MDKIFVDYTFFKKLFAMVSKFPAFQVYFLSNIDPVIKFEKFELFYHIIYHNCTLKYPNFKSLHQQRVV